MSILQLKKNLFSYLERIKVFKPHGDFRTV